MTTPQLTGGGAILDEYAAKDSRFAVVHIKENRGPGGGRNAGIDAAKAEYIGFIDSDDWIEPETYELALDTARRTGADIVQWRYAAETKEGPRPSKECAEGFFDYAESPVYHDNMVWDKIFRASLISENQMRFPVASNIGGEDTHFSVQGYCHAKKAYFIDRTLYHWDRTHESTSSRRATAEEIKGYASVKKETCELLERVAGRAAGQESKQAFAGIIFGNKALAKNAAFRAIPKPDYRLYRSIFPELKWEALRYFFKSRSKQALLQFLAAWRLNWVIRILVWGKAVLRRLAGRET